MTATRLLLVRHGERADQVPSHAWNATRFDTPRPKDPPLTPVGREQAASAASLVREGAPSAGIIYTSPLRRCLETAAEIAGCLNLPVKVVVSLAKPCRYFQKCKLANVKPQYANEAEAAQILRDVHPEARLVEFQEDEGLSCQAVLELISRGAAREHPKEAIPQVIVVGHCEAQKELAHTAGVPARIKTPYCGVATFEVEQQWNAEAKWTLVSRPPLPNVLPLDTLMDGKERFLVN